ncbi:MAG: hypothetical protein ACRDJE_29380 [Dehalococcoidia bacterium]
MTTGSTQEQQARDAMERVIQRARSSKEFAERYRNDPVDVLVEEGMPVAGVFDVLREEGATDAEVSGFLTRVSPSLTPQLSSFRMNDCTITCICTSSCCFTDWDF